MVFETSWRLLGNRADVEECVQEALLDAFRMHSRQVVDNWGGLLRLLVTRRSIDCLRRRRHAKEISPEAYARHGDEPEQRAVERELAARLRAAVSRLPDQQASVFALQCFGEMSRSEVAGVLGITENAVGVALHKARTQLNTMLVEENDDSVAKPRDAESPATAKDSN